CSCEKCGSHHCEHSSGVCQCKPNVEGQNCERCVAKAYGYSSCQGCRMCECATASANPQCDSETGKCLCQPGATGRRCEQCEQGYWNYQESGCIKCDCEADLSLGTVCDVSTGQCHCMDGATGPRCDQCIEGYLRVPDYGCRYCDQCVHVLVDDLDRMEVRMTSLENDLGNVSFVYLTNKRLSRLNDTLSDMELSADPLLKIPTSDVAKKAKEAVDGLKSIADEISMKVNRTEALANKNNELGAKLEEQALMIRRDSHVINIKIKDIVAKLLDMAINFGQGTLTTQRREWYIKEANETVDSLRNMNFDEHYNDAVKKVEDSQDPLNNIESLAANQSAARDKYNKVFKSMEYAHDKFIDLQDSISKATDMLSRSTVLTELTKKHPFFVARGIKTDDELSKCDEFTKNATMWYEKAEQLVISAKDMFNDTVDLTNKTKEALANMTTNTENPPDFEELRRNVLQKVQELVKDAEGKVDKFADAKADSSKAQEAASAYQSMYSATQGLSVGSQEAKVNSMAILRGITKTKGAVVNDLKGNLTQIKNRLKTSNETLSDTIKKFSEMKSDFDKLNHVDKNAKVAAIEEKAKKVKDDINDMQNRLSTINEALPKMKEKVQREISSVIDAQENLKAAMA
uniref:Laminin EGF-like domain-containing protein n=1 Tax=Romanomermis culicivorax TaxID=13658 RepID=A0A915JLP5_ROMCU